MSRRAFTDAGSLLNDLLDRLEARPGTRKLLAYVDEAGFESVRHESECVARLDAAERAGAIAISRARSDGVLRIRHVMLTDATALYEHLRRIPSTMLVERALGDLLQHVSPTMATVVQGVAESWRRNVSRFGLAPGDSKALLASVKLAEALRKRGTDSGLAEIDYRTFSRSTTDDSKALDRLKGSAIAMLRLAYPENVPAELDDDAALNWLGVVRFPQPFLVSGPIAVSGAYVGSLTYVGVPAHEAKSVTLSRPVRYVLLIENFTSFVRHARELNAEKAALVIYSGGFPSRGALRAIVDLCEMAGAPTFHWGDLDAGGGMIFRHIEVALAAVAVNLLPHLMEPDRLAMGLPSATGKRPVAGRMEGSAISGLWDALSSDPENRVLEQEAIDPCPPL